MKFIRKSLPYLAAAGLFAVLGFIREYHLPAFKDWLKVKIESESKRHAPLGILCDSLDLTYWPIGVKLNGVRASPLPPLAAHLSRVTVDEVHAAISVWSALRGRFALSFLKLKSPTLTYINRRTLSRDDLRADFDPKIFTHLRSFPVHQIQVENLNGLVKLEDIKAIVKLKALNFNAEQQKDRLRLTLSSPGMMIKNQDDQSTVEIGIATELLANETRLEITSLKVSRGKSFVIATGVLQDHWWKMPIANAQMKMRTQLDFDELTSWVSRTFSWIKIPRVQGSGNLELSYTQRPKSRPNISFSAATSRLVIEQFTVGDVIFEGTQSQDHLDIRRASIKNPAGHLNLKNTRFQLANNRVHVESQIAGNIELRELLKTLSVGDTPLHLPLEPNLACAGEVQPNLKLVCRGSANAHDFTVHSGGENPSTIVSLEHFATQGFVTITAKAVSYDSQIQVGPYAGSSKGVITYAEGFKIHYRAQQLGFDAIANLVNLKFAGSAAIEGKTEGDSNSATVDMQIGANQLFLEDFYLGNVSSKLNYKDGILSFRDLTGNIRNTRYTGLLSLHLEKERIFLTAKAPYLDASDLRPIVGKNLKIPVELTGSGAANIRLWGPLDLQQMSFNFSSALFRGSIAGETFDQVTANLRARDGTLRTDRIEFIKNQSRATLSGTILPSGFLNATLRGRDFRLEDSTALSQLGLNLTGILDFDTLFKGPLRRPEIETTGSFTQMTVGAATVADSRFRLNFASDRLEGQGNFLGKTLFTSFVIPYDDRGPFSLKINAMNWDFAPFFAVFSDRNRDRDYETRLTADIDLHSESGGIWGVNGRARVREFRVRRGPLEMSNPGEIVVDFRNGAMTIRNFTLAGPNTFFRIEAEDSKYSNLNVSINGKVNLGLGILFAPFLDDLRGNMSTSIRISGPAKNFQLMGTTLIDNAYIRVKGFPTPFEKLKADLLFNQTKVVINSAEARVGGGALRAQGRMDLKGFNNIPTQIEGQLANVTLDILPGIRVSGSGPILISGHWFPFLISGSVSVSAGQVTREFGGADFTTTEDRYLNFLPDFLSREVFEPIALDIQVNGDEPIGVKNSVISAQLTGRLRVRGTPTSPLIGGQLSSLTGGKLFFNETEFDIRTADLKFSGEKDIDPTIYLEATTRVQSYDIQLLVQGKGSRPRIELTSSPALPERDIISLLALGVTTTDIEQNMNLGQQTNQGYYQIGTALLSRTNLKNITDKLGIDFQLSSGFNPSDNIAENRLTLSKQVNRKLGISFSRVTGGDIVKEEYELKYRLSKDLSVIGSLKQRRDEAESSDVVKGTNSNAGTLGIDLEYKIEFK